MYPISSIDQLSYFFQDRISSSDIVINSFTQSNIDVLDTIFQKYISRKKRYEKIVEKLEAERIGRIETEYDFDLEMRSDMEEEREEYEED